MPNEKYQHKYKQMWDVTTGEYTVEQLKEAKKGGCDELGIVSVINPPDGSLSVKFIGIDEKGNDWTDDQWFKMWALLAAHLKNSKTLPQFKRELTLMAHEGVRQVIMKLPPSEEYEKIMKQQEGGQGGNGTHSSETGVH